MLKFVQARLKHIHLRSHGGSDTGSLEKLANETVVLLKHSLFTYPLGWAEATSLTELFTAEQASILPAKIAAQCADLVAQKNAGKPGAFCKPGAAAGRCP